MDLSDLEKFCEIPSIPKENTKPNGLVFGDEWFNQTATYDIFEEMEQTHTFDQLGAYETTSTTSTSPDITAVIEDNFNFPEITDEELRNLPVKQLNKKLRDLPKKEALKLRKRRRSLKNRGYALNCRNKRLNENEELHEKNKNLLKEVEKMKVELAKAKKDRDLFKQKYERINNVFSTLCTTSAMALHSGKVSSTAPAKR